MPSNSSAARQASRNVAENVPRFSLFVIDASVSSLKPCFLSLFCKLNVGHLAFTLLALQECASAFGPFVFARAFEVMVPPHRANAILRLDGGCERARELSMLRRIADENFVHGPDPELARPRLSGYGFPPSAMSAMSIHACEPLLQGGSQPQGRIARTLP